VDEPPPSPSLAEEQQQRTKTRIRQAAMEVVARRGFDATVEAVAEASGVSPRTVFRHYSTHDRLILTTVRDMFEACGRRPIEGLTPPEEDLDAWIDGLAAAVHRRNHEILGEAFWDIHAPHPNATSETLSEVNHMRRELRLRGVRYLTDLAWRTAGGTGAPPPDLMLGFALNFSAFATKALMVDFDETPAQVAVVTGDILKVLLHRAVARQLAQGVQTQDGAAAEGGSAVPAGATGGGQGPQADNLPGEGDETDAVR